MADLSDKSKHKPSPKHTLEELRKSLEDLVRNQLDEAPAEDAGAPAGPQIGNAPERRHAAVSGRPPTLDTDELLESLKELISEQLEEPRPTAVPTADGAHTGPVDQTELLPPTALEPSGSEPEAFTAPHTENPRTLGQAEFPVEAEGEGVPLHAPASDSGAEEITLEALSAETGDVGVPRSSERPLPVPAAKRASAHTLDVGPRSQAVAGEDEGGAVSAVKVVEIPYAGGTLRAFAIRDPVLGSISESSGSTDVEQSSAALPTKSISPVFAAAWALDLAREPFYSELGLLEEAARDAGEEQSGSETIEEITLEVPDTSAPVEAVVPSTGERSEDDAQPKGARADEGRGNTPQSKRSAGAVDRLEIPGGEQPAEPSEESFDLQTLIPSEANTDAQLTLDIGGEPQPVVEEPEVKASQSDAPGPGSKASTEDQEAAALEPNLSARVPRPSTPETRYATGRLAAQVPAAKTSEPPTASAVESGKPVPEKKSVAEKTQRPSQRSFVAAAEQGQNLLKMPAIDFAVETLAAENTGGRQTKVESQSKEGTQPRETARQAGGEVASAKASTLPLSGSQEPFSGESEFIDLGRPSRPVVPSATLGKTDRLEFSATNTASPAHYRAPTPPTRKPERVHERAPKSPAAASAPELPKHVAQPKIASKPIKPATQTEKATVTSYASAGSIPVLEAVVSKPASPRIADRGLDSTRMRPADKKPVAEKASRPRSKPTATSHDARARALAVQIVAKLNSELRKCGERALSPATIERLQYLLREALEATAPDSLRDKR